MCKVNVGMNSDIDQLTCAVLSPSLSISGTDPPSPTTTLNLLALSISRSRSAASLSTSTAMETTGAEGRPEGAAGGEGCFFGGSTAGGVSISMGTDLFP